MMLMMLIVGDTYKFVFALVDGKIYESINNRARISAG